MDMEREKGHHSDESSNQGNDVERTKGEAPANQKWDLRTTLAVISLSLLWIGSQEPLYFVGAILTYMAEDLGGEAAVMMSSWLPVSNTLALASIAPFSGYLTDIFGRRNITLFGAVIVMVGLVIVGTAHSFGQGVAGMAIAGSGAGVTELIALSGVAELVPVKKRGLYLAFVVCYFAPLTPYVLYAQLLATRTSQGWRWVIWISLILNGVAFIGAVFTYFPERNRVDERGDKRKLVKKIDYIGAFFSIVGVTLFLVGLQSGGYSHPWKSAYVLCTLLIGATLLAAFIAWEWRGPENAMVPRELFQGQRVIAMAFLVAFIGGMNFYSLINFFPLSFQTVFNPNPIAVGLKGLGYGISIPLGTVVVNTLFSTKLFRSNNKYLLLVSTVIMTAFTGALAAVTPDTPRLAIALGTIAGFGVGGILVPCQTIAVTVCPDHLISTTVALSLTTRVIGGSIGYSIYYNIFSNKLKTALPQYMGAAIVKAGLPTTEVITFIEKFIVSPSAVAGMNGVTAQVIAAATRASQEAYAYSLKYVWLSSIAFGVISIFATAFLGENEKFLTDRIAAKIRH